MLPDTAHLTSGVPLGKGVCRIPVMHPMHIDFIKYYKQVKGRGCRA
jgi:hypothetical protein